MINRKVQRTDEQSQFYNTYVRVSMAQFCESLSRETRAKRNEQLQVEQRQTHRFVVDTRRANDQQVHTAFTSNSFLAFDYVPDIYN